WIVDPLDGTVNFTHGLDRYAVSVAAESCGSGRVAAAAIVRPATGSWLALCGNGVAGSPGHIRVTPRQACDALLSFAVPSQPEPRRAAYCLLATVVPHVQDLRNFGSTVCDLAAVAVGEIDGFISFDAHDWDVAAGIALVIASGGSAM